MDKFGVYRLNGNLFSTLCSLAELSRSGEFSCTTAELAAKLGCSQQTASRHLIVLEGKGLIARVRTAKRQSISIAPKGLEFLTEIYSGLRSIFERSAEEVYFEGEIFSGLGEGSYYIGQEGYRRQFKEKLGIDPYPGTLNIRLKPGSANEKRRLETLPLTYFEGFRTEKRSFGPVKGAKAIINDSNVKAAVVLALRSHYGPDVVEIVSGKNLRRTLKLGDGDIVRVKVMT